MGVINALINLHIKMDEGRNGRLEMNKGRLENVYFDREGGRECVSSLMREDRIIHPSLHPYEGV